MCIFWFVLFVSETLGNEMCDAWQKELDKKANSKKQPSLLKATSRVFGWRFALLGFLLFILELGLRYVCIFKYGLNQKH